MRRKRLFHLRSVHRVQGRERPRSLGRRMEVIRGQTFPTRQSSRRIDGGHTQTDRMLFFIQTH
ncbi:hypothetical protein INR49_025712 [Caranx melampygus]|nr:hypothetical protein INR49_025712 [Caranx melampygus]